MWAGGPDDAEGTRSDECAGPPGGDGFDGADGDGDGASDSRGANGIRFDWWLWRDRRCRKSEAEMAEHLTGNWREEHLFNLAKALEWYDFLQRQLGDYRHEIGRGSQPI